MDQVVILDKCFQTRYDEYQEMFSAVKVLPYRQIKKEWSYYLELTLDPNGWQAIWKIPRIKCEELKIVFPSIVLVYVLKVNYEDLNAHVRILAVQDDIDLPATYHVPLSQLWLTKDQDNSIALNLNSTANALDMYRFFYLHLIMPWDEDEDSPAWSDAHLTSRLKLFYDLRNGTIPKNVADKIATMLNEARRLDAKRKVIQSHCDIINDEISKDDPCNKEVEKLAEINVRIIEIQNTIEFMENELFRNVLIKRETNCETVETIKEEHPQSIWLIFKNGIAEKCIEFLTQVEKIYPNHPCSFASDLMEQIKIANSNDIILLSQTKHEIKRDVALIENFTIRGIGPSDLVQIKLLVEDVALDFIGNTSIIENVTLDCKNSQCAMLVRKGHVMLKNCKILGDYTSTVRQGILVLNGAKLTISNCLIDGFSMAIVSNSGSAIHMTSSTIRNAFVGLKFYDNSQIEITDCVFENNKLYGIVLETEKECDTKTSSIEQLSALPGIQLENINCLNNKNDVVIKSNSLKAIQDLFANPDCDPTIIDYSDDDMDAVPENEVVAAKQQNGVL